MNGREPNEQELSDRLKWPIKEVTKMESELRNTLTDYTLEPETVGRMGNITKKEEYFRLLYNELDNTEKLVYEYGVGFGGKPKLNVKEMAKKLNTYPSNIVRIKKSIIKKLNKYMTEGQNLNR
jgi:DNA-directed RNA polymerase specialized sigma subunit